MTAEIFLAVFLASILVAALQWVCILTVYRPLNAWWANRRWDALQQGDRCIDPGGCTEKRYAGSLFCQEHGIGSGPRVTSALFSEYPAFQGLHGAADFVSLGAAEGTPGVLDTAAFDANMRHFDAHQDLGLAALDVSEGHTVRLHDAARAFRETVTPKQRRAMLAMAAFRKAQHAPDDPM